MGKKVKEPEVIIESLQVYTDQNKKAKFIRNSRCSLKTFINNINENKDLKILSHNDNTGDLEYKNVLKHKNIGLIDIIGIYLEYRKIPIKYSYNNNFATYKDGEIKYIQANELKIGDRLILNKDGLQNHTIYNDNNLDILLGFILGDGSISKNQQTTPDIYRLSKTHGMCQREYCLFCSELFDCETKETLKSGYTGLPEVRFSSKSFLINKNFIKALYDDVMKKRITKDIEKYFTLRTLALWYMDDGSCHRKSKLNDIDSMRFHTEGFSYEENEILKNILQNKFNIESKILKYKKNNKVLYYLSIGSKCVKTLQDLIKEYIHPSMNYKLDDKNKELFKKELYYKYLHLNNITSKRIEKIEYFKKEYLYNIKVEDNNNYFLNGILVRN